MSGRAAFLALALLASALLAVIALELGSGAPEPDASELAAPVRHPPRAPARAPSEDPEDHTDAWLAIALARPLFSRDRKPTPVDIKQASAPGVAALPRLTGVIVGSFGRTAIFAAGDGGRPVAVSEGKTIGPYKVESIAPGSIVVSGPTGRQTIAVSADAKTRDSLAAEMPRPQITGQGLPPGPPGFSPGQGARQPPASFNPQLRQNPLNPRPGPNFPLAPPNQGSN